MCIAVQTEKPKWLNKRIALRETIEIHKELLPLHLYCLDPSRTARDTVQKRHRINQRSPNESFHSSRSEIDTQKVRVRRRDDGKTEHTTIVTQIAVLAKSSQTIWNEVSRPVSPAAWRSKASLSCTTIRPQTSGSSTGKCAFCST